MDCTRRSSFGYGFGHEFDSRRLHHIRTSVLIQCWCFFCTRQPSEGLGSKAFWRLFVRTPAFQKISVKSYLLKFLSLCSRSYNFYMSLALIHKYAYTGLLAEQKFLWTVDCQKAARMRILWFLCCANIYIIPKNAQT